MSPVKHRLLYLRINHEYIHTHVYIHITTKVNITLSILLALNRIKTEEEESSAPINSHRHSVTRGKEFLDMYLKTFFFGMHTRLS